VNQEPKQKEIYVTDLAKELLNLRLENKITVNALARIFNTSPMILNQIEDNIIFPTYDLLEKYAKYFHVKIIIS